MARGAVMVRVKLPQKSIQPCPNSQHDRLYLKPYQFKFRSTIVQVFYVFRFQLLPMSTINDNAPSTENVATVPGAAVLETVSGAGLRRSNHRVGSQRGGHDYGGSHDAECYDHSDRNGNGRRSGK
ncbi:hypothetical protein VOLCADRAFT_104276 [Volvox carteri f. nagariensis]|uniref:Uncharacterized protein n=1 Tax=Volvox carteri f. nagariensis TaxID=3068 RepID=D8TRW1_VOLCA|nr:uncharacterized protein VOLCADRAFT_104276 [Volvox carteri f. nagariensis]EFJ49716.1 hypothetical protein VOLCADRAFT_104276 [Volvox carteri f. nagariensis]|eukprot:XP_002949223.1 hypothetical protein VOLCADRAFT_104276 [Volvox carteri f. nagariensis]